MGSTEINENRNSVQQNKNENFFYERAEPHNIELKTVVQSLMCLPVSSLIEQRSCVCEPGIAIENYIVGDL